MSLTSELKETLTLILAGGQGERLRPLTDKRAKPAVPFGGSYRIIDFTLSNCIHSGLRRIFLLTQYKARSLEEHIRFGWNFLPRRLEQFISTRPPHHQGKGLWYQGTADAIYQNLDTIEEERPRHVLILAGDHIYKMDYSRMIREHLIHRSALTIGAVKIPASEARHFGILQVDARGRVTSFVEKPKTNAPEIPGQPGFCLASMGIYVYETDELLRRLRTDAADPKSSHDFGKDIIPRMIEEVPVYAHNFIDRDGSEQPYWRDVGTLDALYDANMDLLSVNPKLNLYDLDWPIYSLWHADPPAKTVLDESSGRRAEVTESLLCPGVIVSGGKVRRSILGNRAFVDEHALVEDSILFGGVVIGKGAKVRRAILDKWVKVPDGFEIGYDRAQDAKLFTVTESGITVVPAGYDFGVAPSASSHTPEPYSSWN
ncbi:MAG: glucose-1-phosphate adenylyltransferase [Planctomycetes bacterium]|nr:glucose-1-phosphate adenylyltransferase [Planctomycetota bacterium]